MAMNEGRILDLLLFDSEDEVTISQFQPSHGRFREQEGKVVSFLFS